jgi:hypothetical protein
MPDDAPEGPEPATEPTPATEPVADPWADPSSARAEIEKLRKESAAWRSKLREVEPLAAKARELEDAQKTELQKLQESRDAAKSEATTTAAALQRFQVTMEQAPAGVSLDDIRWVAGRAQGSTPEELAADVADLFARLTPPASTPPPANGGQRPVEQLRPGAMPTTPQASLADQVRAAEAAGDREAAMRLKSMQLAELRAKQP